MRLMPGARADRQQLIPRRLSTALDDVCDRQINEVAVWLIVSRRHRRRRRRRRWRRRPGRRKRQRHFVGTRHADYRRTSGTLTVWTNVVTRQCRVAVLRRRFNSRRAVVRLDLKNPNVSVASRRPSTSNTCTRTSSDQQTNSQTKPYVNRRPLYIHRGVCPGFFSIQLT